eukprot:COSAG01_NODE_258_length_20077_cov_124.162429_8_plen_107_part_00
MLDTLPAEAIRLLIANDPELARSWMVQQEVSINNKASRPGLASLVITTSTAEDFPSIAEVGAQHDPQLVIPATGAGEDNGIDHNKDRLRFPYDSTFWRSHYLRPHP